MKVVLMTVDAANKQGIEGSEKLTKSDLLILLYVKGKKNISAELKEALSELKAEVEYAQMETNADLNVICAYYAGFHSAKNHDVFVVTPDKDKINAIVSKNAKVYTGFKSIVGGTDSGSTSKKSSSGKSSSTKKSTTKKSTTKNSTAKKSTTKKSTTKKSTTKKQEEEIADILTDLASGKINTEKIAKKVINYAAKKIK